MNAPELMETKPTYEGLQGKILDMLGSGLTPEIVATAMAVTPGYVSQLMADEEFAKQVTEKRFLNLQAANVRDRNYDTLEDQLLEKMQDLLPMMYKPEQVLRAITVINGAKRRGATAPEHTVINNTVVQLTIPTQMMTKFVKSGDNHVVAAGDQELITMQSTNLTKQLEQKRGSPNEQHLLERVTGSPEATGRTKD